MFCFGTKKAKYHHKVKTTQVIERDRDRDCEPVRHHRRHRHSSQNFYSNGRYYNESRSFLPHGIELGRYQDDPRSFQEVVICNYREGDRYLPQQYHSRIDHHDIEEDDSTASEAREIVRYSAGDERNEDEVSTARCYNCPKSLPSYKRPTASLPLPSFTSSFHKRTQFISLIHSISLPPDFFPPTSLQDDQFQHCQLSPSCGTSIPTPTPRPAMRTSMFPVSTSAAISSMLALSTAAWGMQVLRHTEEVAITVE